MGIESDDAIFAHEFGCNRTILICDIDGVLADCTHRLKYLKNRDYDKFYSDEEIMADTPIKEGCELFRALSKCVDQTVLLTGRAKRTEQATRKWLENNGINCVDIVFRPNNDWRPAQVIKKEAMGKILCAEDMDNVSIFYIDDKYENIVSVCSAYKNMMGLTVHRKKTHNGEEQAVLII